MKSTAETNLADRYRQFLIDHPIQHAALAGSQRWAWIDTQQGDTALILLPGLMGEAETSFCYIQALAADARVVSVSFPPSVGQVAAWCDGLRALLDHLRIQQAVILGGSSSGFLAQVFVRRYPTRIGGLILTHTGLPDPAHARTARIVLRLLYFLPFGLTHRLMQRSVRAFFSRRTPAHAFWRIHFQEVIRRQNRDGLHNRFALFADVHDHYRFQPGDLAGWPAKILIMEMRRDQLTNPREQAALRAMYPRASVHVFADTAHYDSVEQPEEQIEVIRDFLREGWGEDGL